MAYERVNWQNQPSTATPVNAENLNKMDKGIKDNADAIDTLDADITSRLAEKANRSYVDIELDKKADQLDVDYFNSRVDEIITTPAESISEQEIIDARQGQSSLGANITTIKNEFAEYKAESLSDEMRFGELQNGVKDEYVNDNKILKRTARYRLKAEDITGYNASYNYIDTVTITVTNMVGIQPSTYDGKTGGFYIKGYTPNNRSNVYDELDSINKYVYSRSIGTSVVVLMTEKGKYISRQDAQEKLEGLEILYQLESEYNLTVPEKNTPTSKEIVRLGNDLELVKSNIEVLENDFANYDDGQGVPDYVTIEANRVAKNVLSKRNADSFVFAAISDTHSNGQDESATGIMHASMGLKEIQKITQMDMVALLGDYVVYKFDESAEDGFIFTRKNFVDSAIKCPLVQLQGNHDELNTDTTEEGRQRYYAYIGANNVGGEFDYDNKFRNYGYHDFDKHKIRVIYLNTADVSDFEIETDCHVSSAQIEWLINKGLNVEKPDANEWSVIALTHHPFNWPGVEELWTVLSGFKGKKVGSVTVEGEQISYNFETVSSDFICHVHGHLHNFRAEILTDPIHQEDILTVTIPNASFWRNNEYGMSSSSPEYTKAMFGDVDEFGNQRQFNKTQNTAQDTAFNVVVIDKAKKEVHCINYGAGIDRKLDY